jgi:hypothetical protein
MYTIANGQWYPTMTDRVADTTTLVVMFRVAAFAFVMNGGPVRGDDTSSTHISTTS